MQQFRINHTYDEEMDWRTWNSAYNPIFAAMNAKPWKKELAHHKTKTSKYHTRLRANAELMRQARLDVEEAAEDLIRQTVSALEMMLTTMEEIPARHDIHKINQKQLHNAVWHLKTKCGVKFEENEFSHKVDLAPRAEGGKTARDWRAEEEKREQHQSSLRIAREIAEQAKRQAAVSKILAMRGQNAQQV